MGDSLQFDVTELLAAAQRGDRDAERRLWESVYERVRAIAVRAMGQERPGHTLQPTAVVHEVYCKLLRDQCRVEVTDRVQFFSAAARAVREILVDHARRRGRRKRGGGQARAALDVDDLLSDDKAGEVLAVDDLMEQLRCLHPGQAQIVELRFFGGLTMQEIASVVERSKRSVEADWSMARTWLRQRMQEA